MTGELTRQPTNPNQLQEHKFQVAINRFPNVTFWAQKFEVPAITLPVAEQNTPFTTIKRPGNKITFDPLVISFILDEDLWGWSEIFSWITAAGRAENFSDLQNLMKTNPLSPPVSSGITSDLRISLTSSKNNPRNEFVFKEAWPSELAGFKYDASGSSENTLVCDITFEYTTYTLERLVQIT